MAISKTCHNNECHLNFFSYRDNHCVVKITSNEIIKLLCNMRKTLGQRTMSVCFGQVDILGKSSRWLIHSCRPIRHQFSEM